MTRVSFASISGVKERVAVSSAVPHPSPVPLPGPEDDDALEGGLGRRDREILAFEQKWWKFAGAKEQAVRELFGMSATRYYQVLNELVDRPAALAHDPMLVRRLRRLRQSRQRARAARRLGAEPQ